MKIIDLPIGTKFKLKGFENHRTFTRIPPTPGRNGILTILVEEAMNFKLDFWVEDNFPGRKFPEVLEIIPTVA